MSYVTLHSSIATLKSSFEDFNANYQSMMINIFINFFQKKYNKQPDDIYGYLDKAMQHIQLSITHIIEKPSHTQEFLTRIEKVNAFYKDILKPALESQKQLFIMGRIISESNLENTRNAAKTNWSQVFKACEEGVAVELQFVCSQNPQANDIEVLSQIMASLKLNSPK